MHTFQLYIVAVQLLGDCLCFFFAVHVFQLHFKRAAEPPLKPLLLLVHPLYLHLPLVHFKNRSYFLPLVLLAPVWPSLHRVSSLNRFFHLDFDRMVHPIADFLACKVCFYTQRLSGALQQLGEKKSTICLLSSR